jgi:SAM-dependent methyltransferase
MSRRLSGWDAMARWRDAQLGERGDLWHRALVDPVLLEVIGPVRGQRVLDLACGNGYLTRRFASAGAAAAIGVDASAPTLSLARARERRRRTGARFVRAVAGRLGRAVPGPFDLVVAHMALMDIRDGRAAIAEAARRLAPGGRVVFSISHPCFDLDDRSGWLLDRGFGEDGVFRTTVWRKVRSYRDEREGAVPWDLPGGTVVWTRTYHRTLSTYVRWLREAGLLVRRIEEPFPQPEMLRASLQGPWIAEVPLHLVVEAVPDRARRPGSRSTADSRAGDDRRSGSGGRRPGSGSRRRAASRGS